MAQLTLWCCHNEHAVGAPFLRTEHINSSSGMLTWTKGCALCGLTLSVLSIRWVRLRGQSGLNLHCDLWLIKRPFLPPCWPGAAFVTWLCSPVEKLHVLCIQTFSLNPQLSCIHEGHPCKKSVYSLRGSAVWINTKWHFKTFWNILHIKPLSLQVIPYWILRLIFFY